MNHKDKEMLQALLKDLKAEVMNDNDKYPRVSEAEENIINVLGEMD